MADEAELEAKLWKALRSDRTVMLGLVDEQADGARPMTAQIEQDGGPMWFFTSTETELVRGLGPASRAVLTFAARDHDLFAVVTGLLTRDDDAAVVDRLWNPHVAVWYEGGKSDPKLALLRFEAGAAEVWLNETSLLAGLKLLFGTDPKESYEEKTARLSLGGGA
jgi:general stress protein 26